MIKLSLFFAGRGEGEGEGECFFSFCYHDRLFRRIDYSFVFFIYLHMRIQIFILINFERRVSVLINGWMRSSFLRFFFWGGWEIESSGSLHEGKERERERKSRFRNFSEPFLTSSPPRFHFGKLEQRQFRNEIFFFGF